MRLGTEIRESVTMAIQAVVTHKLRSVLATLGIVIGVVTVSLMSMTIDGINRSFMGCMLDLDTGAIFVERDNWMEHVDWWETRGRREITLDQAKQMIRLAGDRYMVSPYVSGKMYTIEHNTRSVSGVRIKGTTEEYIHINSFEMADGRFYDNKEVDGARPVCVLGEDTLQGLYKGEDPLGKRVKINGVNYEVIGMTKKRGTLMGVSLDNVVYIPITRMIADFAWHPNVGIAVKAANLQTFDDVESELRAIMRKIRRLEPGQDDDFAINTQGVLLSMYNKVSGTISAVGLFITGLSLFVGGIGIMNIMFVSVVERTKEIGLRKSLGAHQRTILLQFLLEAMVICLAGGVIGVLFAWGLTPIINVFLPSVISLKTVIIALIISAVTGMIAGYIPALRAARMDPVEALRND